MDRIGNSLETHPSLGAQLNRERLLGSGIGLLWLLAPGLAKKLVKRLFFKPTRKPHTDDDQIWLDRGHPFEIDLRGSTIRGCEWGEGPAVVLVHGWSSRGLRFKNYIDAIRATGCRAVTYDAPGHGRSDGRDTNYFELTDVLRKVVQNNRDTGVKGIIAHSLGAAAAVHCLYREQLAINAALIAPALKLQKILTDAFDRFNVPQALLKSAITDLERFYGYNLDRDEPHKLAPKLQSNVLVIHDRSDRAAPYGNSDQLCQVAKGFQLHTTEGLGHRAILNDDAVIQMAVNHACG